MDGTALHRTLSALASLASARGLRDALVENIAAFRAAVDRSDGSPASVEPISRAVDDWLAQMVGPLVRRTAAALERNGAELAAVHVVLRALWVLLARDADARAELAEVGGLVAAALSGGNAGTATRALERTHGWWMRHQWAVVRSVKRAVTSPGP